MANYQVLRRLTLYMRVLHSLDSTAAAANDWLDCLSYLAQKQLAELLKKMPTEADVRSATISSYSTWRGI